MESTIRRVVTSHLDSGKAVVLFDSGEPLVVPNAAVGFGAYLVWTTEAAPSDISSGLDGGTRGVGLTPPNGGSIFRIVEFPPEPADLNLPLGFMMKALGEEHSLPKAWPPRHAYTHRSATIDYAVVMSGEIDMVLDDSEVRLRTGDVVVQQGTNHAWVNRGTEPCRIAFVQIDAQDPLA